MNLLLAVLVLGMLFLALLVWSKERKPVARVGSLVQAPQVVEPATPRTANVSSGTTDSIPGLPRLERKPRAVSNGFEDCPAEGDGGDRTQNRLKNRVDSAAWMPADFDAVRLLSWPRRTERRRRDGWTRSDRAALAKFEGLPLAIEGYFAGVKQEGPEATNCHGADAKFRDWHIWLAPEPGRDRTRAIVVETTPPVRSIHPDWTLSTIRRLARDSTRVRVSGWLFYDPEHPDQIGRTRGTLWEIHPVMRIEAWKNGHWEEMRR